MPISKITNKGMGAGAVLQVVSVPKTDAFTTTSTSYVDITGLSASITPLSASSKILVLYDVNISVTGGAASVIRALRNGSPVYIGDAAGVRPRALTQIISIDYLMLRTGGVFLDSPNSTSAVTYSMQMYVTSATGCINRTASDRDLSGYDARGASSITLLEIAA